jgi:hypothetical protein
VAEGDEAQVVDRAPAEVVRCGGRFVASAAASRELMYVSSAAARRPFSLAGWV